MRQFYTETSQQLTTKDFNELSKLIGMDVPEDLKLFYCKQNGGRPELGQIKGVSADLFEVQYFLPVKYKVNDIRPTVEEEFFGLFRLGEPTFDKFCIPIASTIFGDGIYYSLDEKDFGSIFYYVHDTSDDMHFRDMFPSLNDMLDSLVERDEQYWED